MHACLHTSLLTNSWWLVLLFLLPTTFLITLKKVLLWYIQVLMFAEERRLVSSVYMNHIFIKFFCPHLHYQQPEARDCTSWSHDSRLHQLLKNHSLQATENIHFLLKSRSFWLSNHVYILYLLHQTKIGNNFLSETYLLEDLLLKKKKKINRILADLWFLDASISFSSGHRTNKQNFKWQRYLKKIFFFQSWLLRTFSKNSFFPHAKMRVIIFFFF